MTESFERLVKSELQEIAKNAQKISFPLDERTLDYELSIIETHLATIRQEIKYERHRLPVLKGEK